MSYSVVPSKRNNQIVEKATKLTVGIYECQKEARAVCRGLNLGSGFNGLTPAFFCLGIRQAKKKGN